MSASNTYRRRQLAQQLGAVPEITETANALDDIFETQPVDLETFLYSPEYLSGPKLSEIQYDYLRHAEQIYYSETYELMAKAWSEKWKPVRTVNLLALQFGKGSGKDFLARLTVVRCAYLLMCLKSPQRYFGIPDNDEIHMLNVAASADQARRAFFSPMKRLFVDNPVLNKFFRGDPPSELSTSIRLKKNIEIVSGHSMADTQEGLNILVGVADEISAFKTEQELKASSTGRSQKTAAQIVKMLRTSARTRFPRSFKVIQISYPRFVGDAIQQAVETGKSNIAKYGDRSQWYVSGPHATWEVNPRVTRENFQTDYDEDPEMAAAMYECRPPKAVRRFIRDDVAIADCFLNDREEPVEVEYYWGLPDKVVSMEGLPAYKAVPGWQAKFHYADDFRPKLGAVYALHGDLAVKGDRAGIAMSHTSTYVYRQHPNGQVEERPIIHNDFVFGFEADLTAINPDGEESPREVQLRWYRQLIWELLGRGFYIAKVTFDGFQSVDMIQTLNSQGVLAEKLSLDINDTVYQNFKDTVLDRRLQGYYSEDLVEEIRTLDRLPNRKIDHPPNGSKDLADALAGSVFNASTLGGADGDGFLLEDIPDGNYYEAEPDYYSSSGTTLLF